MRLTYMHLVWGIMLAFGIAGCGTSSGSGGACDPSNPCPSGSMCLSSRCLESGQTLDSGTSTPEPERPSADDWAGRHPSPSAGGACIPIRRYTVFVEGSYAYDASTAVAAVNRVFQVVGASAEATSSRDRADIVIGSAPVVCDGAEHWGCTYSLPGGPGGPARMEVRTGLRPDLNQARRTVMHEAGHLLGLGHHPANVRGIFNYLIQPQDLNDADRQFLLDGCGGSATPTARCGDGVCSGGESCATCSGDCSCAAPPLPVLLAPSNNAQYVLGQTVDFAWSAEGITTPLLLSIRRCMTPRCSGSETGRTDDLPAMGGRYSESFIPGDYRWTVFYTDARCPDGRCAANARLFSVRDTCRPRSCADLGRECGSASDGCGGTLNCPSCPSNRRCNTSGRCELIPPTCTCSSGACCDGCNVRSVSAVCGERPELRCNGTTGGLIEQRVVRTYCPGTGTSCSGATTPGDWALVRRCGPAERCDGGATPTCVPLRCAPGATMSCFTGRPGICADGTQTCGASGDWGMCVAFRAPTAETCNSLDDDCDGGVDEDGVCGPPPATLCEVTVRRTESSDFRIETRSYSGVAVGSDFSIRLAITNDRTSRYYFSRTWITHVDGDAVTLATDPARDYENECLYSGDEDYFDYTVRVARTGTANFAWGGRRRFCNDDACDTCEDYHEFNYLARFAVVVTCR